MHTYYAIYCLFMYDFIFPDLPLLITAMSCLFLRGCPALSPPPAMATWWARPLHREEGRWIHGAEPTATSSVHVSMGAFARCSSFN